MPVCSALAAAHARRRVHRDVKPSNVFLHRTPRGEVTKILDFGIAKLAAEAAIGQSLTIDGSLLGTPGLHGPRALPRAGRTGRSSDIYSVGAMLYEMLAGRLPFIPSTADPLALVAMQAEEDPPPLRARRPDVSPALEALVLLALSRRTPTAAQPDDLARRLALVVADPSRPSTRVGLSEHRHSTPTADQAAPPARRRPRRRARARRGSWRHARRGTWPRA